jgi:hypothetical protein
MASETCSLHSCKHFSNSMNISIVDCIWNVMAHMQKPDFVFQQNGRVDLNRRGGHHFGQLLAAELCASAVVMLDTSFFEVMWRVLATHSIRQFPLHFPSNASVCAITFQLDSTMWIEVCHSYTENKRKWTVTSRKDPTEDQCNRNTRNVQ